MLSKGADLFFNGLFAAPRRGRDLSAEVKYALAHGNRCLPIPAAVLLADPE